MAREEPMPPTKMTTTSISSISTWRSPVSDTDSPGSPTTFSEALQWGLGNSNPRRRDRYLRQGQAGGTEATEELRGKPRPSKKHPRAGGAAHFFPAVPPGQRKADSGAATPETISPASPTPVSSLFPPAGDTTSERKIKKRGKKEALEAAPKTRRRERRRRCSVRGEDDAEGFSGTQAEQLGHPGSKRGFPLATDSMGPLKSRGARRFMRYGVRPQLIRPLPPRFRGRHLTPASFRSGYRPPLLPRVGPCGYIHRSSIARFAFQPEGARFVPERGGLYGRPAAARPPDAWSAWNQATGGTEQGQQVQQTTTCRACDAVRRRKGQADHRAMMERVRAEEKIKRLEERLKLNELCRQEELARAKLMKEQEETALLETEFMLGELRHRRGSTDSHYLSDQHKIGSDYERLLSIRRPPDEDALNYRLSTTSADERRMSRSEGQMALSDAYLTQAIVGSRVSDERAFFDDLTPGQWAPGDDESVYDVAPASLQMQVYNARFGIANGALVPTSTNPRWKQQPATAPSTTTATATAQRQSNDNLKARFSASKGAGQEAASAIIRSLSHEDETVVRKGRTSLTSEPPGGESSKEVQSSSSLSARKRSSTLPVSEDVLRRTARTSSGSEPAVKFDEARRKSTALLSSYSGEDDVQVVPETGERIHRDIGTSLEAQYASKELPLPGSSDAFSTARFETAPVDVGTRSIKSEAGIESASALSTHEKKTAALTDSVQSAEETINVSADVKPREALGEPHDLSDTLFRSLSGLISPDIYEIGEAEPQPSEFKALDIDEYGEKKPQPPEFKALEGPARPPVTSSKERGRGAAFDESAASPPVEISRASEFLKGLIGYGATPCSDFYQHVCKRWSPAHFPASTSADHLWSRDAILEAEMEATVVKFITTNPESVRPTQALVQACNDKPRASSSVSELRELFQHWKVGEWPVMPYPTRPRDDVWLLAGDLLRDLDLAALAEVFVAVHPKDGRHALIAIGQPEPLQFPLAGGSRSALLTAALKEALRTFDVTDVSRIDQIANESVQAFEVVERLYQSPDPDESEAVSTAALDPDINKLINRVMQAKALEQLGASLGSSVLLTEPKFVRELPKSLNNVSTVVLLNYLLFRALVRLAAFLPDTLSSLRKLSYLESTGRADQPEHLSLCLRTVERAVPRCFLRAIAAPLTKSGAAVWQRRWLSDLENILLRALRRIPWLDSAAYFAVAERFQRLRLDTGFSAEASDANNVPCATEDVQVRHKPINAVIELFRRRPLAAFRSRWRLTRPLGTWPALDLPSGRFRPRSPGVDQRVGSGQRQVAVRLYAALAPVLYVDSAYDRDVPLGSRSERTAEGLMDCVAGDLPPDWSRWVAPRNGERDYWLRRWMLSQVLALELAFQSFRQLSATERVWTMEQRFANLAHVSSAQLFFIYYALDHCEKGGDEPDQYKSRELLLRSRLPASAMVNLPLRHVQSFITLQHPPSLVRSIGSGGENMLRVAPTFP
ncbi:hypothetical protein HPB48_010592 [Haemaphysalis longicornis]|uniref:Peptidase M13 N-terminal domain-containing protein n=1 Tax=Haemaphysalis longicornis TaxID=44386 RepID=A0A9J6H2B7_HAELO|nr:hypothetical protein HPB48_010592 [Haemaphysalis longicornis]